MRLRFALTHIEYLFGDTGNSHRPRSGVGGTRWLGEKGGRETFRRLPLCALWIWNPCDYLPHPENFLI